MRLAAAKMESIRRIRNELICRRARRDILGYASAIDIPGKPAVEDPETEVFAPVETTMAAHHRLILTTMEEVSQAPHGRAMFFMPPGSAKSTYGSVVFPSAYLGRQSGRRLILASYGSDLARKMGRRTRSIIKQDRYRDIFEAELDAGSSAAHEFALTNGSEYMAGGILAGMTGNRAHGLIIDDPVKGREAAESEPIRKKSFEAYEDDLKTRLVPGGWIVLIQTRWHEDDVAGRILPEGWKGESGLIRCRDGMDWRVICLQARCDVDEDPLGRSRGDYLWPEWFDRQHWAQFENSPRTWASLYQQIPSPPGGTIFKPDAIPVVDAIPAGTRFVRGWDLGASENEGDPTAGGKLGLTPNGQYIIADMVLLQGSPDQVEAAVKNTAARDGKEVQISMPQDPGQAGKAQVNSYAKLLAGYGLHFSPESGDKITRAEPLAAQGNVGNVLMLRAPWNDGLISEMRMFPNGRHDDQVDCLSRAFARLIEYTPTATKSAPLRI